jgi:anti-sigma regulatory factor (Ser/Thr protein kinase)
VCRVANFEFDRSVTSVRAARHFVAACMQRWEITGVEETALLLTSELVSNAVKYTSRAGVVSTAMAGGVLEVGVTDFDPQPPGATNVSPSSMTPWKGRSTLPTGGRGLMIVDRLADEWGVESLARGKHVWFRLNKCDWNFRSFCHCDDEHVDRILIGSGQLVSVVAGPWDH